MILSLTEQGHLFLISMFLGFKIHLIFDLFRVMRKIKKTKNLQVGIQDVIFVFLITIYTFYIYLYESNGAIRIYYFVGMLFGGLIYNAIFSKYIMKTFIFTIEIIKKSFERTYLIITFPMRVILKLIKPRLKIIKGRLYRKLKQQKIYALKPKRLVKRKIGKLKEFVRIITKKV